MPLPRHQSQHLVWTREAPPQPQKAPPTASADFRAFGVVSLRLQARACGSDGVVSAMRVLIRPIDSMPTSLLQRRLSRSGLSTAAATVPALGINMSSFSPPKIPPTTELN